MPLPEAERPTHDGAMASTQPAPPHLTVDRRLEQNVTPVDLGGVVRHDPVPWLRLSFATAALAALGSVIALFDVDRYYGAETDAFIPQAIAQDIVNLVVVAPLMAFLAWRALRGSLTAYLVWLGVLAFTVYNYVIYTVSIHFGPLFLLWVAVLGSAGYALVGGCFSLDATRVANALDFRHQRLAAGFLLVTAALFAAPVAVEPSCRRCSTGRRRMPSPTSGCRPTRCTFSISRSSSRRRNRGGLTVAAATTRVRRCTSGLYVHRPHRPTDPHHRARGAPPVAAMPACHNRSGRPSLDGHLEEPP